jgi:hypothetical protein
VVEVHLVTADAKPLGGVEAGRKRSTAEAGEGKTAMVKAAMGAGERQRWRTRRLLRRGQ